MANLPPVALRVVENLLHSHVGWNAASLSVLRSYGWSCHRLEQLQEAGDVASLYRETRINLQLLRALELEP